MARGKVYLVGAGPGDPGLLTIRGRSLIESADVVYYDGLVGPDILRLIPRGVRRVRVAKSGHQSDPVTQSRINALLLADAKAGRKVVRLKGGDPFLLSRGGEEAESLRKKGIAFEVVPGVTSALAAPASAGIPLTERGWASSVVIVTGHESASTGHSTIDWAGLARTADTLVILMGVSTFPSIARKLIEAGLPASTPVSAIRWGTTPRQQTVLFTLGEALQAKVRSRLRSPSVLVVGRAAARAHRLRWNPHDLRWTSLGFDRVATQLERGIRNRERRRSGRGTR